ncbi:MAG: ZPR1 zinc finger domain-containing protein [Candidatus Helarchaeota archaeon]
MVEIPDSENFFFKINCPVCNSNNVSSNRKIVNVPHYGDLLLLTLVCNECGYKFNDIFNLEFKTPQRYILKCETVQELNARVIKSGNCTIRIPELEVEISPGPSSEGYITNVEGILQRVESVLNILKRDYETIDQLNKIIKKLEQLNDVLNGEFPITLIIEDPSGNSSIIYDHNLSIELLSEDEINSLEKGYLFSIDVKDLKKEKKSEGNEI